MLRPQITKLLRFILGICIYGIIISVMFIVWSEDVKTGIKLISTFVIVAILVRITNDL